MSGTITIDFETYYSQSYSLSTMPMQAYIMSTEFDVVGVAVKVDDEPTTWVTGDYSEVSSFLKSLPWEGRTVIAHNASFDVAILRWVYNINPTRVFCTMFGSRPNIAPFTARGGTSLAVVAQHLNLGAKGNEVHNAKGVQREQFNKQQMASYADYCVQDVDLCYAIYKKIIVDIPQSEQDVINLTVRKFTNPQLVLDKHVLEASLISVKLVKKALLDATGLADRSILMSNEKFASLLSSFGVEPPTKISPTTGKETYAFAKTDEGMKELVDSNIPEVSALAKARLAHKSTLEETRTERLLALSEYPRFAVPLIYYGAHTGRFSGGGKLNLQNLSRGSELRRAITVPPGKKLVAGDLSQIEARMVATLAGEDALVDAFANGEDVYCLFASQVYGKPVDPSMGSERFVGKQGILQLGYQAGHIRFQGAMKQFGIIMDENEAKRIVTTYRSTYSKIAQLWKLAQRWVQFMAGKPANYMEYGPLKIHGQYGEQKCPAIELPNGMAIYYPDLYVDANNDYWYTSREGHKKLYGGALIENISQALARIVIVEAELRLAKYGIFTCNQVHDEIHVVCDEASAEKHKKIMELALSTPVDWLPRLPVACEVGVGDNYMEAH